MAFINSFSRPVLRFGAVIQKTRRQATFVTLVQKWEHRHSGAPVGRRTVPAYPERPVDLHYNYTLAMNDPSGGMWNVADDKEVELAPVINPSRNKVQPL